MRYATWDDLTDDDWKLFARSWLNEMSGREHVAIPELPDFLNAPDQPVAGYVTQMTFAASPECQWKFILASLGAAADEEDLGRIGIDPMTVLLWKHGDDYIGKIGSLADRDLKLRRAMKSVIQHGMPDAVWERVTRIQSSPQS